MTTKCITALLILYTSLWSQTLTAEQIKELQTNVKNLPDESVSSKEVVVIETDLGNIVIKLYYNYALIHAMNLKKLAQAGYFSCPGLPSSGLAAYR